MTKSNETNSEFARLLKSFETLIGVPCIWKRSDSLLPDSSLPMDCVVHQCEFCRTVKECSGVAKCIANDQELLPAVLKQKKTTPFISFCHAGAAEIILGIFFGKKCIGALFIGPFRVEGKNPPVKFQESWKKLEPLSPGRCEVIMDYALRLLREEALHHAFLVPVALPREQQDSKIKKLLTWMEMHENEKISIAEAAHRCFMSISNFKRLFHAECGIGFGELQRKIRLYAARNALLDYRKSILGIALEFGFCSQSHFTMAFRDEFKLTPMRYRAKYGIVQAKGERWKMG